jgi:hypothetical protein
MYSKTKISEDFLLLLETFFSKQRIVPEGATEPVFVFVKDREDRSTILLRESTTIDREEIGDKPIVAVDVGKAVKRRLGIGDLVERDHITGVESKIWIQQRPLVFHCISENDDEAQYLATIVYGAIEMTYRKLLVEEGYHDVEFVTIGESHIIHHRGIGKTVWDVPVFFRIQYVEGYTTKPKVPIMAGFEGPIYDETGGA